MRVFTTTAQPSPDSDGWMDDESPPAKAEAQVRRPLRIPKSKAKGFTVNAISKSMTPLTKSLNWGWGNYFNSR